MRSQQKIQNLLHVLIREILEGESVRQVRHRHGEPEPKIFSSKTERGSKLKTLSFSSEFVCLSQFLSPDSEMSPTISLKQEQQHFVRAECGAQTSACYLQAAKWTMSF